MVGSFRQSRRRRRKPAPKKLCEGTTVPRGQKCCQKPQLLSTQTFTACVDGETTEVRGQRCTGCLTITIIEVLIPQTPQVVAA